jgi:MFS transporter, SP family, solute carrier family 2 (facilitated glucose transporter), member 1
MKSIFGSFYF